jgi:glycogen debranching enzyme
MRKVNPDLVIVAELFTGEAGNDDMYEASIGIDLLVKEAMQINSVQDLMGKLWRCSNVGIADVRDQDSTSLRKTKARAIIYDATHDNSTCHTKFGSFRDSLPLAAAVAAAPAAMGSSVGFDSLRTIMPSVVTTDARTRHDDILAVKVLTESRIHLPGFLEARSVSVYGDWNDWEEGIELQRHSDGWYLTRNADVQIGEYKFLVNKVDWVVNSSVGISSGQYKNNLYGTAGRFCDVKRRLLEFQNACNSKFPEFYSKVYPESNVMEIKRFNSNCEGYVFLIRFGGPILGGDSANTDPVELELESSIESVELAASLCCSEDENLESFMESHFEGQIVHWNNRDLELASLAPTCETRHSIKVPRFGVVILKMNPRTDLKRLESILPPPVSEMQHARDFSFLLFSCESEEPVYDVPEMGKLVYAGFSGFVNYYDQVFNGDSGKFLASPLAANIRNGDWLIDYTMDRLRDRFPRMYQWFLEEVRPWYVSLPSGLKPRWFVHIIKHLLYGTIVKEFRARYGESVLTLASFQFTVRESVAAGLPHIARG